MDSKMSKRKMPFSKLPTKLFLTNKSNTESILLTTTTSWCGPQLTGKTLTMLGDVKSGRKNRQMNLRKKKIQTTMTGKKRNGNEDVPRLSSTGR